MKKILTKIWGVGLIIALLAGLLMVAAPVSAADPLTWNSERGPSGQTFGIAAGFNIKDYAVGTDGTTVYAVGQSATSNMTLYKSTDGGKTWLDTASTSRLPAATSTANVTRVAVAPDNPSIVAVLSDNGTPEVFVSTAAGAMFSTLGTPRNTAGTVTAGVSYDIAISPAVQGTTRYVAVAGSHTNNATAGLFYYSLGAGVPNWYNACADTPWSGAPAGRTSFRAVAFSPTFASDYTAVALSATTANVQSHILSFNSSKWDNTLLGVGSGYPVTVDTPAAPITVFNNASLALSPDYSGVDEVLRVLFVAYSANTSGTLDTGGIFRLTDSTTPRELTSADTIGFNSITFNGTTLVAGRYHTNDVYRCVDPLAPTPTLLVNRTNKKIGVNAGNDQIKVTWRGTDVLGSKQGVQGAFSISRDDGMTWNDISLINTTLNTITDIYVTPDASTWYSVSSTNATYGSHVSVFRNQSRAWERVLTLAAPAAGTYILRGTPSDNSAIYVCNLGGSAIYRSADAGQTRWYFNSAAGITPIANVAIESASVIYVAAGATVTKSTNGGGVWGPPGRPELSGGNVYSIKSISEGNVLVGGSNGSVSYSTDGGATWAKMIPATAPGAGVNLQVTADNLSTGGKIYVAPANAAKTYRWIIGTNTTSWTDMLSGNTANQFATGIQLIGGALYVATSNGTAEIQRTLMPGIGTPNARFWGQIDVTPGTTATSAFTFNTAPTALYASTANNKLWAIGTQNQGAPPTVTPGYGIYSYEDTLATTSPTLSTPNDGSLIQINPATGAPYNITMSWSRPSWATTYSISISLDAAGTQVVGSVTAPATGATTSDPVTYIYNPTAQNLMPGTTYYWTVSASTPVTSAKSAARKFNIQPAAAAVPTIGAPANGATITNTTTPSFSWSPLSGTTMYQFQIASDTTFATPITDVKLATTGYQVATSMAVNKTYFWRVRGFEPSTGDWSTIANFTLGAPPTTAPPVQITQVPAPIITIPAAPPATTITIPPPAPAPEAISPTLLWAIIIIGAILVIALIVLIVRTRRTV